MLLQNGEDLGEYGKIQITSHERRENGWVISVVTCGHETWLKTKQAITWDRAMEISYLNWISSRTPGKVFEFSKLINYKLDFKRKRKWSHIGQQWLGFGHETCMRKRKWSLTMIKLIWKMHLPYFIHDSKCSIHVA